jgi:cation diffusion facilitator CzcD-associated flavoprotein CzcO
MYNRPPWGILRCILRSLYNDVVIIGAGFSSINLACQLRRKLNFTDYVIYDRALDLGGTWSANKCKLH